MTKLLTASLFAASTFAMPMALVSSPAVALTCGVDAPAGWERPGGFCDALKATKTLAGPVEGAPAVVVEEEECEHQNGFDLSWLLKNLEVGERVHVALNPDCHPQPLSD